MQKFFQGGGQIWGTDRRGGGRKLMLCGMLHPTLARGGGARMTQVGENASPPLKYSPA